MPLRRHWWTAPTNGEYPALPPDQIPDGGARELRNFLVHNPGKIIPRGSIGGPTATIDTGTLAHPSGHPPAGQYHSGDIVALVYRDASGGVPQTDVWRVPINKPTSAGQLAQPALGAQAGRGVDLTTGTITDVPASDPVVVGGHRAIYHQGYRYTVGAGGASTTTEGAGVAQLNYVQKATLSTGVVLTHGPQFVQDVIIHYNRVFVAAARNPDAASGYNPCRLYFTRDGGTTGITNVLTDWTDEITGLVNTIEVGSGQDDDFIVALGRAAGQLVILLRRSVWVLYGTSVEDFVLKQVRTGTGCIEPRSVSITSEGVYFASQLGLELWDGARFSLMSTPVQDVWQEFCARGPGANTVNHAYIRTTPLPNEYLFVSIGVDPSTTGTVSGAERSWLVHTRTGAWTQLSSALSSIGLPASGAFARAIRTNGKTLLFGTALWARADLLTHGTTSVRDQNTSASFSVPLRWKTGLADVGARWETAALQRATVDYAHAWDTETPTNEATFATVALIDGLGAVRATPGALPGYRPSLAPLRNREVFDTNHELARGDVELDLASNIGASSSLRNGAVAIYGAGVEYEPGRNRRL